MGRRVSKQYLHSRSEPVTLQFILPTAKEGKMRFARTLVSFIGLTVMLLSAELWLTRGLAAQGSRIVFTHLGFDNFEIYVMDADGGNRENLSNHPSGRHGSGLVARRVEDCIRFASGTGQYLSIDVMRC